MKIIKSVLVFVGAGLMSLSCFADTKFYCPASSSIHAEGTNEGYHYIGVNENGLIFSSKLILDDVVTAPPINQFVGGDFIWSKPNEGNGCDYIANSNRRVSLGPMVSKPFKTVGSLWESHFPGCWECYSSNRYDCPFELISK